MTSPTANDPEWLHGHQHDPNPSPPSDDPTFVLRLPNDVELSVPPTDLERYPLTHVSDAYIVSTGHGTSGPYTFSGVRLLDLVTAHILSEATWDYVDVICADDFGTRVRAGELLAKGTVQPIIVSYMIDGQPLTREQGLVRLIVPSEIDDALRQVKWITRIEVH
jgi:DMSO/TMAO reductase YedYZ molybdopterin-dependent catalytic subunit